MPAGAMEAAVMKAATDAATAAGDGSIGGDQKVVDAWSGFRAPTAEAGPSPMTTSRLLWSTTQGRRRRSKG